MARSPLTDIAWEYMSAQILHVATDLELIDRLAEGPRSSARLAEETGTHAPTVLRLLRSLATLGVVRQTEPDRFELTELGGDLRTGTPGSVRDVFRFLCSAGAWSSWGDVAHSLRTGGTAFEHNYGTTAFAYLGEHPEEAAKLNGAMGRMTSETAAGLIEGCDFTRFHTVVDVGGGSGVFLAEILRSAPRTAGTVYDMPTGVTEAARTLAAAGVGDRATVTAGNFFESVPEGADAYVMKLILHDWDDEKALRILRGIREAVKPDGRLIIFERVIPDVVGAEHRRALLADLLMLVLTGGRERTEDEYRGLLAQAGFTLDSVSGPLGELGFTRLEAVPSA
ncbi:helix-turn-helix domain-containing protein [Streptomyces sp. TRM66268-LWL]|uniref:Helix-turn-helix domain-containing protein n=1 Tax=Streptomyces polyasparticus TaxID=2767826 RepID=A0ABR7SNJ6_9ACTN|nr:methyltransferase [Streptomyces polyasparticus]MBC9716489.1 helix-turn-helix domain-containing protein [Streptomyces polyasparticus]